MTASNATRLLATQSAQSGRNVVLCDTTGQVEKEIKEIMDNKHAIYNLNVDQRATKFGKGPKLLKFEFDRLPDYIKKNKKKFERWLD